MEMLEGNGQIFRPVSLPICLDKAAAPIVSQSEGQEQPGGGRTSCRRLLERRRHTQRGVMDDAGAVDDGGPVGQDREVSVFEAAAFELIDTPSDLADQEGRAARLPRRHRGRVELQTGPPKAGSGLRQHGRRT